MPEKKKAYYEKLPLYLSAVAGIAVMVLLLTFWRTENVEVSQNRTDLGYSVMKNVSCREIIDADAPIGVKKEYCFSLDEVLDNDTHLAFYTVHQYVEVYLDGEKIYSLEPSKETHITKTVGSNWTMIPLYREDAGKEIRIEITPVYESFRNREVEFITGSSLAIFRDRLSKDLPQLVLGMMAVFVGAVFICVAGYHVFKNRRGQRLVALGAFSVLMGLWRLTDTRFSPFIIPEKPVLLFYVSVTMLMLGMVALTKWIEEDFPYISRCILNSYCVVVALTSLAQLMLQYLEILDLRETLVVTHIMIAVGVFTIAGCSIYDRIKQQQQIHHTKLPFICVAGVVVDIVAYYVKGNSSGLLFSLLAFLLYVVFMGITTIFHYSEQERKLAEMDRQLAEKERQLTQRRIATMMSQIRTHFIFNVLTAISSYCKYDPKKADDALIRFSRYLRKNIKIIEEDGLIGFSMELEQLEDYIALEQMRFEDRITFEKNIEVTSFQIPPLTIQPIVENAIKHGLIEPGISGTITLHTEKVEKNIRITVTDNGAGFSPEELENKDSVGIKNVRYRLESMVGGKLDIESAPGKGTKVVITIPDKRIKKD